MRKTILAASIAVSLFALAVAAADRRFDRSKLSIMTFNAQFLWDGVSPEEGNVGFAWKNSPSEAQEHMAEIADLIRQSDPDIINLVEVENLAALTMLNDQFLNGRGYRPFLVKGTDGATGQDVGLLTRIDPVNDQIKRDNRKGQSGGILKSVSKHYIVQLEIDGRQLALIGLHLLAFPTSPQRRPEREAQADAISQMAVELRQAGFLPIVLGDFNDYDGTPEARDHRNNQPITTVLSSIRGMRTPSPSDDLWNAAELLAVNQRFTAWWDADQNEASDALHEFTSIDHILLAPELRPFAIGARIPHTYHPENVSDHFPLIVELAFSGGAGGNGHAGSVSVVGLLPNPEGDDAQNEAVRLTNTSTATVSLAGWRLSDRTGRTWDLSSAGTLPAGETITFVRDRQPMSLNNDGDSVELRNPNDVIVSSASYATCDIGEWIEFVH